MWRKAILNLGLIEAATLAKISDLKFQIFAFQAIETCICSKCFQLQIAFFQSNCTVLQPSGQEPARHQGPQPSRPRGPEF